MGAAFDTHVRCENSRLFNTLPSRFCTPLKETSRQWGCRTTVRWSMSSSRRRRLSRGRGNSHIRWLNSSSNVLYEPRTWHSGATIICAFQSLWCHARETKPLCMSKVVRGGDQWQLECEWIEGLVLIASWMTTFVFDSPLHPQSPKNCHDAIAVGATYSLKGNYDPG